MLLRPRTADAVRPARPRRLPRAAWRAEAPAGQREEPPALLRCEARGAAVSRAVGRDVRSEVDGTQPGAAEVGEALCASPRTRDAVALPPESDRGPSPGGAPALAPKERRAGGHPAWSDHPRS